MTVDQIYSNKNEELLNRSFKYYYTVDSSAFSNDDFDLFVNSLEKSNRNSTKKFRPSTRRIAPRACAKKLVDYPLTDSDIYENISSSCGGVSYMEVVDESIEDDDNFDDDELKAVKRNINFSGASSVLMDVSCSYECLDGIGGSPKKQQQQLRQLQRANTSLECLLNKNKSLRDIFSYFDEDVKIDDSSTLSLHRIGNNTYNKSRLDDEKFLTYDDEKYDNQVYLYKKQQKSVDNMVNEFQRLKSSYLQQTLNDYNTTRTSTNTVGRLDKNRIQFFENMFSSGDGVPNNTTEVAFNKLNNTEKSQVLSTTKAFEEIVKENLSMKIKSILPLCKILPVGKLKIEEKKDKIKDFDSFHDEIKPQTVIPVFNVNLKGACDKEKSFTKEIFMKSKQPSLNSTPIKHSSFIDSTVPPMTLNHSSPITPPQPPINWETHPVKVTRRSIDTATQTTPKKLIENETNTSPLYLASSAVVIPFDHKNGKPEISARNLSFTTFDATESEMVTDDDDEPTFNQDNFSCFTFDDAPFININDKTLLLALENFLAIWDLSLIDMIVALINENCNLNEQTEVTVRTNCKSIEGTSVDLQFCHMCALAYESNELGAVMKLSLFDPNTNKAMDVKIVFCAVNHDQMNLIDEKLQIVTENILIYVAFLLKPPENELQKSHETNTNLSEHQLRVQASLQRLNVPDWYKTYTSSTTGTGGTSTPAGNRSTLDSSGFLRKRNSDVGRWTGLNSKTTSLSSLGSQRSDRSPVMLSPSSHSHHGQTGFSRWSTSHLNSNQTSPSVSTRGSFTRGVLPAGYQSSGNNTLRGSYRQPYLGWRSQEKLAQQQNSTTGLRTPAERLASSLLQQKQQQQQHQRDADSKPPIPPHHQPQYQQQSSSLVGTPEIKDEIKEVTSAIVHYVNDQQNRNSRSRSTSPSQRCWLESSFVGTKPLESPQTPVIDNTNVAAAFHASSSASLPRHVSPSLRINDGSVNGTGESTYV